MRSLTQQKDVSVRWMFAGFVRVLLTLAAWNISDAFAQGGVLKYTGKISYARIVPEGSSVDLSCELNDPSVAVTLWHTLGTGGMYTPRKNLANYGQLFTLHKVSNKMQGTYICRARSRGFSQNIGMIFLKSSPKDPPKPAVDARQKHSLVSRDVNLTCKATGTRILNVQWHKRARPLSMQQQTISKELKLNGETWINTLVLKNVQINQAGWYECRVFETSEPFGFWSTHVKLNVIETTECPELDGTFADPQRVTGYLVCSGGISTKMNCSKGLVWRDDKKACDKSAPVVKWKSTDHALRLIRKTVGDSVILNCRMSDPNVRVKLKQKVTLGAMRERITDGCRVSRHGQTFVIHAVNFKDFGIYYCEAPHLKIKRKEEAYLEVQPAPSSAIYQGYRNLFVSFGSSLDLNCGAPNIFQPLIFLEIISMEGITQLTPDGHRVTLTGRIVTIHGMDRNMGGRIVCKVISSCNQAQQDVDLGYLLPVPPKGTPPIPEVSQQFSAVEEGESLNITCSVFGGGRHSISWFKNKEPVPQSLVFSSAYRSVLMLDNTSKSDAGDYECRTTDFGDGYWLKTVTVTLKDSSATLQTAIPPTAASYFPTKQVDPSVTEIVPYQPVDIVCRMFQADFEINLWQESTPETFIQRAADGVAIIRQGNAFTITQGRQNDEGTYYCQAANSQKILAAVLTFPGIQLPEKVAWVPNKSKNVVYMNGADLACIVYSNVPADWSVWLKTDQAGNNESITDDKHMTRSDTSGPVKELVLQIRNATEQDAGIYTCRAQFGGVVREDTLRLTVTGPKKGGVLLHSGSQVVNESQSTEFWCKAGGSPQPIIIWQKHGQDIGECSLRWGAVNCRTFSERHKVSFSKGTSFLRVVNALFYKDDGQYSCTVKNTVGGENVTLHLTVQVKPSIKKDRISENAMIISANKSVLLNCSIRRSSPPPTLTWWYTTCPKDATACQPSLDAGWKRFKTDNISLLEQLLIPPSRDHVLYKCIAENWLGQDSITYTILRRLDDKPPKIINFTTKASVNASQNVQLFCETDGKPPFADVQWFKNGVSVGRCKGELQQNKTCVLDQHQGKYSISWIGSGAELLIKNVFHPFDTGEFTCIAVNTVGMDNKTVHLDIYEKPVLNKKNDTDFRVLSFQDSTMIQSTALRGHPTPHFKWFQQQIRICTSGCKPDAKRWRRVPRHVIDPLEHVPSRISSLYLPPGRKGYFFRCIAENSLGHDDVVFSVHRMDIETVLLEIIPSSPIQRVDEGSRLTILCQASTGDFLHLAWQRRSKTQDLPTTLTRNKHNITSALTIEHARLEDADDYVCYGYGWTANATKISVITVNVTEIVVPVVSLSNQTIQEKNTNSTILTCVISSGYPAPNITWYKDDKKLSLLALRSADDCRINGFHYMEKHRLPFARHLVICKPSHTENTGVYKCEAKNSKGNSSSEAFLNVLAAPKIFNMVDHKLPKELGENVNVSCKATGNPTPSVKWIRKTADGLRVQVTQWDGKKHTLRINSLLEDHYGDYMCLAENTFGNDTVVLSLVKPGPVGAAKGPGPTSKVSLIVAIVVSVALFLVLLLIAAILYRRRQLYGGFYICTAPPLPDMIPRLDSSIPLIEQVNKLPYDKRWEFPREQLHFGKVLGSGAFGEVYLAEAEGRIISDNISAKTSRHRLSTTRDSRRGSIISQGPIKVAVKTLKERAEESERKDLISELKILIHIGSHKNIVNLLAACTKGRYCDICVIIEYCPHGNMLQFLRNKRGMYNPIWLPPTEDPDKQFSMTDVVSAAFQVARAMEFLASRKCVHRDLAARNVLLGENYVVKVADFGLARDVYKDDTYIKVSPGLVPVKWMAIESLTDRVYSEQSDVWSFGVFLWELFTLGGNPYPNIPPTEIYQYIIEGNRMERPVDCPEEMYCMMVDCWMEQPVDRPNFTALVQRLDHAIESNIAAMGREGYLELGNDPVMPREETDDDGYLKPREIVPSGYKAALFNGNLTSGSNRDLHGSNRSLTNESKPKDLIHERYTELGFKPSNNVNDVAETAL